jgi:hypothetical protein
MKKLLWLENLFHRHLDIEIWAEGIHQVETIFICSFA